MSNQLAIIGKGLIIIISYYHYYFVANATSNEASCPQVNSGGFLAVFIIGEILHCFGGTTLYSIGIVYIDSNYLPGPSAFRQGQYSALVYPTKTDTTKYINCNNYPRSFFVQVFCMPSRLWVQHSVSSLVVFLLIYTLMWTKFQPAGKLRIILIF